MFISKTSVRTQFRRLILNKFVGNYIKFQEEEEVPYSEHQANLIFSFCHCIGTKVHTKEFESNIIENIIKLKNPEGEYCDIQVPLNYLQILHYKFVCINHIVISRSRQPRVSRGLASNLNLSESLISRGLQTAANNFGIDLFTN